MAPPDEILMVTPFRRRARRVERALQAALDAGRVEVLLADDTFVIAPTWANGVRVQRAGRFQWAVVATFERGH